VSFLTHIQPGGQVELQFSTDENFEWDTALAGSFGSGLDGNAFDINNLPHLTVPPESLEVSMTQAPIGSVPSDVHTNFLDAFDFASFDLNDLGSISHTTERHENAHRVGDAISQLKATSTMEGLSGFVNFDWDPESNEHCESERSRMSSIATITQDSFVRPESSTSATNASWLSSAPSFASRSVNDLTSEVFQHEQQNVQLSSRSTPASSPDSYQALTSSNGCYSQQVASNWQIPTFASQQRFGQSRPQLPSSHSFAPGPSSTPYR
jgi:hypothetical protein